MLEYFWKAVYQFVFWIFKGLLGLYSSFSEGPPYFSGVEGPRALLIWNTVKRDYVHKPKMEESQFVPICYWSQYRTRVGFRIEWYDTFLKFL